MCVVGYQIEHYAIVLGSTLEPVSCVITQTQLIDRRKKDLRNSTKNVQMWCFMQCIFTSMDYIKSSKLFFSCKTNVVLRKQNCLMSIDRWIGVPVPLMTRAPANK